MAAKSKLLLLVLLQSLLWNGSDAVTAISKSDLDVCVNTGDPKALKCKKKIVVTLAIPSGDKGIGEALITQVKDPSSRDGMRALESRMIINFAKTESSVRYTLEYLKNVAGDLFEHVVKKKSGCNTKLNHKASCGILVDPNGNFIIGSSGFCCTCAPFKNVKQFRGQSRPGGCNLNNAGYAFCLRFGDLWYFIYRIRTGRIDFKITITLTDQYNAKEYVYLSPSMLSGINNPRTLIAYLIGDMAPYTQPPRLDGKYLLVPTATKAEGIWREFTNTEPRLSVPIWIVVDQHRVTDNGMGCDKINLSPQGYTMQGRTCNGVMGMCIGEQVIDFLREDKKAFSQRRLPIHSLLRYGTMTGLQPDWLGIVVSPTNSLLTVEISADTVSFRRNKSTGKVVKIEVAPFEAMSTAGSLTLTIINDGDIEALFVWGVECSKFINPLESKFSTLLPNVPQTFYYSIATTTQEALTHSCIAILRDSEGKITDKKEIRFTTTATILNNGSQGGDQIGGSKNDTFAKGLGGLGFFGKMGSGIKGIAKGAFNIATAPLRKLLGLFGNLVGKCDNCPGSFDIGCFIAHFCVKKILFFVGGIVAAALAFYVLLLLQGMGILTPLCGCCCLPLKIMLSMRPSLGGGGGGEEAPPPKAAKPEPEEIDYEGVSSLFDEEGGDAEEHEEDHGGEDEGDEEDDDDDDEDEDR